MPRDPVAEALRDALAPATARLARVSGDLWAADDAVQDAAVVALERWPVEGVPERPDRWLIEVARNRAIDRWRREATLRRKLEALHERDTRAGPPEPAEDRVSLLFTCCHPAIPREAQVALTLRAVCGLSVRQIAAAFLVGEATIAQRIVRAKKKIVAAGIPFGVPAPEHLEFRLDEVLAALYLMFNEGYLSSEDDVSERPDLAEDAEWLAAQLASLMPREPEVLGLTKPNLAPQLAQTRQKLDRHPTGRSLLLSRAGASRVPARTTACRPERASDQTRRRRLLPGSSSAPVDLPHPCAPLSCMDRSSQSHRDHLRSRARVACASIGTGPARPQIGRSCRVRTSTRSATRSVRRLYAQRRQALGAAGGRLKPGPRAGSRRSQPRRSSSDAAPCLPSAAVTRVPSGPLSANPSAGMPGRTSSSPARSHTATDKPP
jgi:RNA polymerase sigma factor (sigma-70 family)